MAVAQGNKTKEKKIMKDKLDKLAFAMRNYVSLVAPSKVILIGPMFDDPEVYDGFIKAYREYDESVPDCFFRRSKVAFTASHIDPLATALNEWLFSAK
jgi:predicted NBD/HSP70 family sugar kinase